MQHKSLLFVLFLITPFLLFFPFSLPAENDRAALLPLSNLAIPQSLGKVQERFKGQSDRTVIQIQDVHAHLTAQENIAAIVDHLRSVCGIKTVALEGAWTGTSLPQSRAIPTSREKQLLARSLMEQDLLSGPLYAAILSPLPVELSGLEDPSFYEQNRKRYLEHRTEEPAILEKINSYAERLHVEAKGTWPNELLSFGDAYGKFYTSANLPVFLSVLSKAADAQKADFQDLEQIVLLKEIMTREAAVSKERLETEIKQLMREYKNTSWNFEELLRSGNITSEKFGSFPEIKKLRQLLTLRDKISLRDLMNQVAMLTIRVLEKLIKTPEERALWEKTGRFYLAEKLLLLQATPEDLKKAAEEKAALGTELQEAGLADGLNLSLAFYDLVQKRDEIFFNKIMKDPSLAGDIMVVTGGFHTEGLSQRLREAGISYITLTPDLGTEAPNEKLYATRMGEARADAQTLSELRNATAWVDERFTVGYTVLLQTKDVRKAAAAFLGKTVPISAPEKTSHLRATGKIYPQRPSKDLILASPLPESEFMSQSRAEQLATVRGWLEKARSNHEKILLVSQASTLKKMLPDKNVPALVAAIVQNNDTLVLIQDAPLADVPESLLSPRGMERFDVKDMDTLINQTPRFQRLAKKHPFAIMKNGYQNDAYIVLPEIPVSLVLYRVVALNPDLYRAVKDPAFLALLQNLVAEILGQELTQKAA